jgi:hypothetical protein
MNLVSSTKIRLNPDEEDALEYVNYILEDLHQTLTDRSEKLIDEDGIVYSSKDIQMASAIVFNLFNGQMSIGNPDGHINDDEERE